MRWVAPSVLLLLILGAVVTAFLAQGCVREPTGQERRRERHYVLSDRSRFAVEPTAMIVREVEPVYHPIIQCQIGERRPHPLHMDAWQYCVEYADGSRRYPIINTPLVIVFDNAPVTFTQSNAAFRIGEDERTEWVSAATPWLALDRDGSGCIESERELFAGFGVLARLDANADGRIDDRDPAFHELVLWADRNQDKKCTPDELTPLGFPIDLAHTDASPMPFSYEGETASLPTRPGRVVDVYLARSR